MIAHKLNTLDAIKLYNLDSTDFTWHNASDFADPVVKTYLTDRDARLCEVTVKNVKVKHLPSAGHALGGGSVDTKQIPGYYVRNIPMLYVNYFDAETEFMFRLNHGVTDFVLPADVTVI